jgi:hypothetical protein
MLIDPLDRHKVCGCNLEKQTMVKISKSSSPLLNAGSLSMVDFNTGKLGDEMAK